MKKCKRIKSFAAIVVALVMILSLNIGAFASGAATEYIVDFYDAGVYKTTATYTYNEIGVALPDCGADGWEFQVYTENLEDGTKTLCPSLSYTSSADNNVVTEEMMDMLASAVDLGSAGYEIRYEAYTNRSGGSESEASPVGWNAISLTENWQETMFDLIGFASAGSGSNKYFAEGSAAPEGTVYRFLNQTQELNAYVNAEGYVELPYAAYMNIANAYFANAPEMKTYLTGAGLMDAETEQVYYYQGGAGGDWAWVLSDVEICANGYNLRGIFCSGQVEDTTGLTEYVDYYVCNGYAYAIDSAVELTVAEDDEHGYRIAAYTEKYYYLAHTEEMGDCIYGINPETDRFSELYYCVYSNSGDYGIIFLYGTGHYTFDDHLCYTADQPVEWETAINGSSAYDYACHDVTVTRTFEGEETTTITGTSGVLSGGGEVWLWSTPCVEFKIEAPHCTVEVLQGLTDRGDGSYSYMQTDAIELKITPDAGYEVTELASYLYDVYVVMGSYISASGTWLLYPEFIPSTILVTTTGSALPTDGDGTGVTVETGEGSAAAVKVQVPEEDAAKVTGLSLVAEELEETAEENAAALLIAQAGAEEDKVYLLDIHFVNADGQEVKVGAEMLVTLPIPEGWDSDKVSAYYVNPDAGEVVDMNGVVSEDGTTVSFTTNHFSYYAVVQKADAEQTDPPEEEPEAPATEDPTPQPPTEDEPSAPPADDSQTTNEPPTASKDTTKVESGDSNNPALWFALMLLAGTGLLSTGLYRKMACRRKGAHER